MARPQNPDLTKNWKICLSATLAGTVELYLFDRLHGKPKYGSRSQLLTRLLSDWVVEQKNPDARANAILDRLLSDLTTLGVDQSTVGNVIDRYRSDFLDAIRRGLETELAPSPITPPPLPSVESLA